MAGEGGRPGRSPARSRSGSARGRSARSALRGGPRGAEAPKEAARREPAGAAKADIGGNRLAVAPVPLRPPMVLDDSPAAALEPAQRARLESILSLPPRERLDALIEQPDAALLVPAVPPDTFVSTLLQVGLSDGDVLLVHASDEQLVHLCDVTSWTGDELDLDRSLETLEVLRAAGDHVVLRWLRGADDASVQALFSRLAVVTADDVPRPGKLDELELGAPFSLDGVFTIWPRAPQHVGFLRWILTVLFEEQQELYLWLCQTLIWILESEVEHEAYGMRERRLIEHGFPPPEQAAEIFLPVEAERLVPVTVVETRRPAEPAPDGEALILAPPEIPAGAGFLARCAERLDARERLAFRGALERLSKLVLAAEWLDPGRPEHREIALRRAGRTVALALEHLSRGDAAVGAALLLERTAVELFRTGQTLLVELPRRVAALRREGWLARVPDAIGLLDPELRRELEACRHPRPQRFAGLDEEGRPRYEPYASLAELDASRRALDTIDALGRLLVDGLGLPERFPRELDLTGLLPSSWAEVTAGDILRTAVVQGVVRGSLRFAPVSGRDLAEFARRAIVEGRLRASVRDEAVDALLARLPAGAVEAGSPARAGLEAYLEGVLDRLGDELGALDPRAEPDVRFVGGVVRLAPDAGRVGKA